MVPSQIIAVLSSPAYEPRKLASLEMLQSIGAPLLLEHKRRLTEELPGRFYELYGLTEGMVTILDKHDAARKTGSVGCPPAFCEIKILRADDIECAPGEVGEICGRAPIMMAGYYKRPDLTAQTIRDGWLHSGDAGYLDEEGYLFLADRIKDMIISGGVNVYPKDIEEVIIQHPRSGRSLSSASRTPAGASRRWRRWCSARGRRSRRRSWSTGPTSESRRSSSGSARSSSAPSFRAPSPARRSSARCAATTGRAEPFSEGRSRDLSTC